jgi:hypothetical protein
MAARTGPGSCSGQDAASPTNGDSVDVLPFARRDRAVDPRPAVGSLSITRTAVLSFRCNA